MTGRTPRLCPLSQQHFARVALQEEGFGHEETVEHLDDVAVLQHEFRPAGPGMTAVPERRLLGDLELRVRERRPARHGCAEKPHHGPARTQYANDFTCERLRRRFFEEIEEIPA